MLFRSRQRPGELLHVDTKKLGRFSDVGHRIHGDYRRRTRGLGWEHVHVCVDDHTRLAYAEVLADERQETAVAFLRRAVRYFERFGITIQRVLTDNGSCYRAKRWYQTCQELGIRVKKTRPYRPQTNGKAERFIQTLLREWAYERPYKKSAHRRQRLRGWLRHYNEKRPHGSLGGQPPITRIQVQA